MFEKLKRNLFKVCPKSGRIVGLNYQSKWMKRLGPLVAIIALIWFIIRVVPKPSRITYPCQQVATSIISSTVVFLASIFGITTLFRKFSPFIKKYSLMICGLFVIAGISLGLGLTAASGCSVSFGTDAAVGDTSGGMIYTKRVSSFQSDPYADLAVARVYDPTVSTFQFGTSNYDYYWRTFNTDKLQSMLERGLMEITGTTSPAAAWQKILPGATSTSKVAVKVNNNNIKFYPNDWYRSNMTDPPMVVAIARSLVLAGIKQENITFFDASRNYPGAMVTEIHAEFPKVVLAGLGMAKSGTQLTFSEFAYKVGIPQAVIDANYLIDCALFKGHSGQITGVMKNLAGLSDDPAQVLHNYKAYETSKALYEMVLNSAIKSRLVLCITEAIFGSQKPTEYLANSQLTKTEFFPNKMCNSVFVSRNPYLLDAVLLSFMNVEKNGSPNNSSGGNITWLKNASGKYTNWTSEAINAGTIVNRGGDMPPKDISFNPAVIEFISVRNGSTSSSSISSFSSKSSSSSSIVSSSASTSSSLSSDSGPAGYTYCANENQTYTFTQIVDVAYGANGKYNIKTGVTGSITFNNATFGDPIPGVVKKGYYKTSSVQSSSRSSSVSSQSTSQSSSSSSSTGTYIDKTAPFTHDGIGEYRWRMSVIPNYINSWNTDILEINGVNLLNVYVSAANLPAKQNGYYYIRFKGLFNWSHFEAK